MRDKKIIIGLGNPGKEYETTRHNAGYIALDEIAKEHDFPAFALQSSLKAMVSSKLLGEVLTVLVKPTTFMNLSGETVSLVQSYYDVDLEDLLVVYDDIDLPLGTMRYRDKGSAGTHNGMRSIVQHVGSLEIPRYRIGIAPDHQIRDLASFVLGRMSEDELAAVKICAGELRTKN